VVDSQDVTCRGTVTAVLRPGTRRPEARCDVPALVPATQGVFLGDVREVQSQSMPVDERVVVAMAAHKPSLCMSSLLSMAEASLYGIMMGTYVVVLHVEQISQRRNSDNV
jgi:hypothetical protein